MSIAVKSIAWGTNASGAATFTGTSAETSATSIGDLVVVTHGNDFYTQANISAPSATGAPTMNAISGADCDGGSNFGHLKSWWYVANTAGTQTVTFTETGTHDEERGGIVLVLSGANTTTPIDGAASSFSNSTGTAHTAPSISPTNSDTFAIVIDVAGGGSGGGANNYTMGSGVTEQLEAATIASWSGVVGIKQLSASGATGTFSITSVATIQQYCSTFGIATAAAGAAAAPASRQAQPGKTWQRRFKHRRPTPAAVLLAADVAFTGVTAAVVFAAPAGSVDFGVTGLPEIVLHTRVAC